MRKGKNSPERLLEEIVKLDSVQFLGVCKILGIDVYIDEDKEKPKSFYDLWQELCDTVGALNRVRRRNLGFIIYAATKKEKEKEKE